MVLLVRKLDTAQNLFDSGEFAQAEALLKELLSGNDQQPAALVLYARCLAERGALLFKTSRTIARYGRVENSFS